MAAITMKQLRKSHFTRALAGVSAFSVLAGLLLSSVLVLLQARPVAAQAAGNFKWINAGTIVAGNSVYYDKNPTDTNHEYINTGAGTCSYAPANRNGIPNDKIYVDSVNGGRHYVIDQNAKDEIGRVKCDANPVPMGAENQAAAGIFLYRSGDNLVRYDGTVMFSKVNRSVNVRGTTNGELFLRSGEQNEPCPDVVVHGTNGAFNGWFLFAESESGNYYAEESIISEHYRDLGFDASGDCKRARGEIGAPNHICDGTQEGCIATDGPGGTLMLASDVGGVGDGFPVALGDDAFLIKAGMPDEKDAKVGTPPAQQDNPEDEGPPTACDVSFNFATALGFKWIICPFVNILMSTIAWLEDFLTSQLSTNMDPFKPDSGYHAVWGSFRTLALAIIIIVALVMVIFEATGIEAFSAYTVRTLFTRFGVAVLFIVLSWSILTEVVNLVNIITDGARSLIYSPFAGKLGEGADLTGMASFMLLLLGTGGILALGPWGLLSFVLTAVLSVFLTVMVLVIVHALIYILVMVSPVAIALSVLPNTRKGYEFWKNALSSILIGLIAVAFAMPALDVIAASTYSLEGGSTLNQIIALLLKFMRVFVVLFIFSRIGGALGTITGMVNDRGRGAFDRLKKFRGNTMQQRHQERMDAGGKVFGSNAMAGGYRRVFNAREGGLTSWMTNRSKARYHAFEQQHQAGVQAKRLEQDHGRAAGNDDANQIAAMDGMNRYKFVDAYMAKGHSAEDAEKALAELETGYGAQIGTKSMQATAARALFASNTAFAPNRNARTQEERDANYREMIETATRMVQNGTMSSADAAAMVKSNKSRPDMAGMSFGTLMGQIDTSVQRANDKNYSGEIVNHEEISKLRRTVTAGTAPGALLTQRHEAVSSTAPQIMEDLESTIASGDNKAIQRQVASIAGMYDTVSHAAPQNAGFFADDVMGQSVVYKGETMNVQQLVEKIRGDTSGASQEFDNMRREYKQRYDREAGAMAAAQQLAQPPDQNQPGLW